ncbi:mitochondrial Homoaconitase [Glutinoglossum americanum]|uniref:Mitochondrial Homoaconitase n=1 Tax=Glutinoglossum americanum TaxID=1670608 RepID=A0A9P8I7R5_9PEZI|nr:mitochondrial Homoaconitase [Glutinoglossum americanum]
MSLLCMENYNPAFRSLAREGHILISGYNFGCGSSREQAATAIPNRGIPLVVAGSFSNIFARDSINNALLGPKIPALVKRLREVFSGDGGTALTRRTGWWLEWDVAGCEVLVREGGEGAREWRVGVGSVGRGVQEIVAKGGVGGVD